MHGQFQEKGYLVGERYKHTLISEVDSVQIYYLTL